eukprot:TRINITY_DN1972_c0_g1_i1.p1 TRINITY_DN1972_c0_g1~~TRINITY_DN1972_c0_g1_i1.p1  ORF type:complete len:758 (-),score=236.37 TRINITY_DN1972_c0_g1_i1:271-2346(-)
MEEFHNADDIFLVETNSLDKTMLLDELNSCVESNDENKKNSHIYADESDEGVQIVQIVQNNNHQDVTHSPPMFLLPEKLSPTPSDIYLVEADINSVKEDKILSFKLTMPENENHEKKPKKNTLQNQNTSSTSQTIKKSPKKNEMEKGLPRKWENNVSNLLHLEADIFKMSNELNHLSSEIKDLILTNVDNSPNEQPAQKLLIESFEDNIDDNSLNSSNMPDNNQLLVENSHSSSHTHTPLNVTKTRTKPTLTTSTSTNTHSKGDADIVKTETYINDQKNQAKKKSTSFKSPSSLDFSRYSERTSIFDVEKKTETSFSVNSKEQHLFENAKNRSERTNIDSTTKTAESNTKSPKNSQLHQIKELGISSAPATEKKLQPTRHPQSLQNKNDIFTSSPNKNDEYEYELVDMLDDLKNHQINDNLDVIGKAFDNDFAEESFIPPPSPVDFKNTSVDLDQKRRASSKNSYLDLHSPQINSPRSSILLYSAQNPFFDTFNDFSIDSCDRTQVEEFLNDQEFLESSSDHSPIHKHKYDSPKLAPIGTLNDDDEIYMMNSMDVNSKTHRTCKHDKYEPKKNEHNDDVFDRLYNRSKHQKKQNKYAETSLESNDVSSDQKFVVNQTQINKGKDKEDVFKQQLPFVIEQFDENSNFIANPTLKQNNAIVLAQADKLINEGFENLDILINSPVLQQNSFSLC